MGLKERREQLKTTALRQIKEDSHKSSHENTIFHYAGHPFWTTTYKEPDWVVRLYYCLPKYLPEGV